MKNKASTILVTAAIAVVIISLSPFVHAPYRLLYNPSESAPRGWYAVVPSTRPQLNDYVIVRLPEAASALAAQRGYLPSTVPLLKHVAGIGGQRVCASAGALSLDDRVVAHVREHDGAGRPLIPWKDCRALTADEVLLLSATSDASFDSRYFGPVQRVDIIGRAIPVWTW